MPSKKSVRDTAIQQLSPALGSEAAVAVAALGLEVLVAVVKLDRTQTAVGLLRFDTQPIKCILELHQCK